MNDVANKVATLMEAMPYLKKYAGKVIVIKYGGNAMINEELKAAVLQDVVMLKLLGMKPVLSHGGGPGINKMLEKLDIPVQFINGLRYTSADIIHVVEAVLIGQVNSELVGRINAIGGEALAQLFDGQIVLPRNLLYSGIHHLVVDTDAGSPGALQNRAFRDETFEHLRPQLLHGRQIDLLAAEVDRHGVHALHQFLFGDDFIVDDSNDAVEIRFKRRSCGVLLKRNLRGFGGFCCGGWSLIRIDMSRSRLIHDACRKNGAGGQSGQKRRRGTQNG